MLERNAAVFTDWPMYEDHLAEEAVEKFAEQLQEAKLGDVLEWLEERARRIKELGGRVAESYWQSDVTFGDDGEYGFRPGAVVGTAIPQPGIRTMLEADPEILNVSINAWPSGAKPGTAPWDPQTRGMVIEGILRKPRGSVDWVFRGGAGGRPLVEGLSESVASILAGAYSAEHDGNGPLAKDQKLLTELKDLQPDQLREYLREHKLEHLIPALAEESSSDSNGGGGVTAEQLQDALDRQAEKLTESFEERLEEHEGEIEERVQDEAEARDQARSLSSSAYEVIEQAVRDGLPRRWGEKLKERYAVTGADVPASLQNLSEEEREEDGKVTTLSVEEVLRERVKADVQEAAELIREAGGAPRIRGMGSGKGDPNAVKQGAPVKSSFRTFLREEGIVQPNLERDGEKVSEAEQIREIVEG